MRVQIALVLFSMLFLHNQIIATQGNQESTTEDKVSVRNEQQKSYLSAGTVPILSHSLPHPFHSTVQSPFFFVALTFSSFEYCLFVLFVLPFPFSFFFLSSSSEFVRFPFFFSRTSIERADSQREKGKGGRNSRRRGGEREKEGTVAHTLTIHKETLETTGS